MCMCVVSVVSAEHSELGLEARWWRRVSRRAQTRVHRSELPGSRLFHSHVQSLHYAFLLPGQSIQSAHYTLTLWRPLLPHVYSYEASCALPGSVVICNFWHPGTLTLSPCAIYCCHCLYLHLLYIMYCYSAIRPLSRKCAIKLSVSVSVKQFDLRSWD